MKFLPFIVICAILQFMIVSCDDTCGENKNTIPLAGFYVNDSGVVPMNVDSLEVYGIGVPGDSILSPASESKERIYLPFEIDSDTTCYMFRLCVADAPRESEVTFIYSRTPRFADAECGVNYIYDIRKIECKGNLIDSVTCPQGFIDNNNKENLRIYLRNDIL